MMDFAQSSDIVCVLPESSVKVCRTTYICEIF